MEPSDVVQPASPDPSYRVPGAALDALRTPLAAILGTSQLLERRIVRGAPLTPDDYLAALAAIRRAAWALEGQLRVLQDGAYRAPGDPSSMESG